MNGLHNRKEDLELLLKEVTEIEDNGIILSELFSGRFMGRNTLFNEIYSFLDIGLVQFEQNVSKQVFDHYINKNTRFRNWEEMLDAAMQEYEEVYL